MNYLESLAYLESLSPTLEKPTTDRIKRFLSMHGKPQNAYRTFHVGGTNGKGSTVAIIDSVLRAEGIRTGRFTGPHLLRWNERFHIDGQPISDEDFADYATQLRKLSEEFGQQHPEIGPLTWFEFITSLAFFYFRDQKIDTAVLEVGLGGRFDATNVLEDKLACSVITNISLDHTHILGDTEELIAFEKAGIIQPGKPVVTGASGPAFDVINKRAAELNSPLIRITNAQEPQFFRQSANLKFDEQTIVQRLTAALAGRSFERKDYPLLGEHQILNAKLAFTALFVAETSLLCTQMPLAGEPEPQFDESAATSLFSAWEQGINAVYWPARLQIIDEHTIMDGAHNPGGAKALRAALDRHFPGRAMLFVISCFDNKDAGGILQALCRPNDQIFLCEAATRRATFPKTELLKLAKKLSAKAEVFESIAAAYRAAQKTVKDNGNNGVIVATGSFATVRECMQEIGWQKVEDGKSKSVRIDSPESVRGNK
jgi:dihydrofolate synthase/folylpolyglutamate synthase